MRIKKCANSYHVVIKKTISSNYSSHIRISDWKAFLLELGTYSHFAQVLVKYSHLKGTDQVVF